MAFGVASCAGIAVPVPGSAHTAAGFERLHRQAETIAEAKQLVEAGKARTNYQRIVFDDVRRCGIGAARHHVGHSVVILCLVSGEDRCGATPLAAASSKIECRLSSIEDIRFELRQIDAVS